MSCDPPVSDREYQAWVGPLLKRAAGYAWAIVRNREDAEDAVQEALLRAYRSIAKYDRGQSFKPWLFTIVRHCCLDLLRRRAARPIAAGVDVENVAIGAPDHEPRERIAELQSAMVQLSADHREILELKYFGDCSYHEIAESLGIPEGTVMSRLHAARLALASIYRKEKP